MTGRRTRGLAAGLLPDHGMTAALEEIVGPHIADVKALFELEDMDGLGKYRFERVGKMEELRGLDVPRDGSSGSEALLGIGFHVSFGFFGTLVWGDVGYVPSKRTVQLRYDTNVPYYILSGAGQHKEKFLRDIGRYEMSIRHEVTHAVRDAATHHIERFVERKNKDERVLREYSERGHKDLDFEVDAIVNSLDQLRLRLGPRYDELDEEGLERLMPGVRLPTSGDPARRKWLERLHREGLLPRRMVERARMVARVAAASGVERMLKPYEGLPLECDGMTRVVTYVLGKAGVAHRVMLGRISVEGKGEFEPHYWVELPDGKVVDYKSRMWFGNDRRVPQGVFRPDGTAVSYEGRPVRMPVSDVVFAVLTS